jgi:hypothetical protein
LCGIIGIGISIDGEFMQVKVDAFQFFVGDTRNALTRGARDEGSRWNRYHRAGILLSDGRGGGDGGWCRANVGGFFLGLLHRVFAAAHEGCREQGHANKGSHNGWISSGLHG